MARIPLVLDLAGVSCLVVGAGAVAERKVRILHRAGARIRLVAPRATWRLRDLVRRGKLGWRCGRFREGDLRGARLVLAATSDLSVNRAVARAAARRRVFVNVADDPDSGSVQMPAIYRRGALLVAISTSGRSAGAARALRDDLARRLGPEYAAYVAILGGARARVLRSVSDRRERRRRLQALRRAPILPLLRRGAVAAARSVAWKAAGFVPTGGR